MRVSPETIYQSLYVQAAGAAPSWPRTCDRRRCAGRARPQRAPIAACEHQQRREARRRAALEAPDRGPEVADRTLSSAHPFTMLVPLPAPSPRPRSRRPHARDRLAADALRRSLTWDQAECTSTRGSRSPRTARSTSATRTRPGSGHQREHQRPAAPVLPQGHRTPSDPRAGPGSPTSSTGGPARRWAARPRPALAEFLYTTPPDRKQRSLPRGLRSPPEAPRMTGRPPPQAACAPLRAPAPPYPETTAPLAQQPSATRRPAPLRAHPKPAPPVIVTPNVHLPHCCTTP